MQPEPSPGFRAAWEAFRERFDWAMARVDRHSDDLEQARITATDIETFLAEWAPSITDADLLPPLDDLRRVALGLRQADRLSELSSLLTTLRARQQWHTSELLLQGTVALIELFKITPPHLLPELNAACAGEDGRPFDAAESYRESEAAAESDEAAFRKSLAALEADFPALATPALRRRLRDTPPAECEEWIAQVTAELTAFTASIKSPANEPLI